MRAIKEDINELKNSAHLSVKDSMQKIKLKNITFNSPAFRKLENIQIDIAERITIIAGHNGIGKSTIIGLIANGSGNRTSNPKSYFDQSYHAHFEELFHLSEQYDYFEKISDKPSVILEYEIDGHILHKKCNVTRHTEPDKSIRLKVVPRTVESKLGDELGISPAGRVPLPTIYLGMSRMTPIGEHSRGAIQRKVLKKFNEEDSEYIRQKFNHVIYYQDDGDKSILSHKFTASKKGSKLPSLNHDSLSISLGQDSLSSIITALASFHQLQREDPEYVGGVLVIDEIDAGFHPHAQKKLISLIKKEAKDLNLQVIATSHSLTVIKEVILNEVEYANANRKIVDSVAYFTESRSPRLMLNPTYPKIKSDMLLEEMPPEQIEPRIKIYFEDDEACYFFSKLLAYLSVDVGAKYQCISAKTSCDTLLSLAEADDYFKSVLIIFDNDVMASIDKRNKISNEPNFLVLPGSISFNESTPQELRTPERILRDFLQNMHDNHKLYKIFWDSSNKANKSSEYVRENYLSTDEHEKKQVKLRDKNKYWFKKAKNYIDQMNLVDIWAEENKVTVEAFIDELKVAIHYQLNSDKVFSRVKQVNSKKSVFNTTSPLF